MRERVGICNLLRVLIAPDVAGPEPDWTVSVRERASHGELETARKDDQHHDEGEIRRRTGLEKKSSCEECRNNDGKDDQGRKDTIEHEGLGLWVLVFGKSLEPRA